MKQDRAETTRIWQLLRALADAARIVRRKTDAHPDDESTLRLLALVAELGHARPSEIAATLDLSPAAVTRRASALSRQGLLTPTPLPEDRRGYTLSLTTAGTAHLDRFRTQLIDSFSTVLTTWTKTDTDTLTRLLTRLNADMTIVDEERTTSGRAWWRQDATRT